jgi:SOS response regulatory protein OraA/RecX
MPKSTQKQIDNIINNLLRFNERPSSACVRKRLDFLDLTKLDIEHHIDVLYEQGKINDRPNIEKDALKYLRAFYGRQRAKEQLKDSQYNTEQIEHVLDSVYKDVDEYQLALKCKKEKFGLGQPKSDEHQSKIVFYLQKLGHKMPTIMKVLQDGKVSTK